MLSRGETSTCGGSYVSAIRVGTEKNIIDMNAFLEHNILPNGFSYPPAFDRIVELQLFNLDPWQILHDESLRNRFYGIKTRYPTKSLVPFATRLDNDDVACFDEQTPEKVVIIHDFAKEGWEDRQIFNSFWDWFRQAIDDMIAYGV